MSRHAHAIVKAAQALGKWTHVGRVNTPARLEILEAWGVKSVDGSGISQYSDMRRDMATRHEQLSLMEV